MSHGASPQRISLKGSARKGASPLRNGAPKASIVSLAPIALLHSLCNLSFFTHHTLPRHTNLLVR